VWSTQCAGYVGLPTAAEGGEGLVSGLVADQNLAMVPHLRHGVGVGVEGFGVGVEGFGVRVGGFGDGPWSRTCGTSASRGRVQV